MQSNDIYSFIREQESEYQKPIPLDDGWNWSMKAELQRDYLMKNGQFLEENENRDLRPKKNIVLVVRQLQNRTEGFDVKNIDIYVNDEENNHLSLLTRKRHEKWSV